MSPQVKFGVAHCQNLPGNPWSAVYLRGRSIIMTIIRTVALGSLFLAASSLLAQGNQRVEANKKVVYDFYRFVWEPKDLSALPKFMPESYVEHNPLFSGTREDFVHALQSGRFGEWNKPGKVPDKLNDPPALITAEGDLVTWIFKRIRKDPKDPTKTYESFWFDTFRIKDGKILEHWDGATRQ
jgi:predicted SnoaL-like aldol condensation-catalyzing enzyme